MRVFVPDHPLIKHWLTLAREQSTPSVMFKTAMTELGRWLTYEACRYWLPTVDTQVQTPLAPAPATFIDSQVPMAVVPILRAGLGLLDGAQTVIPMFKTYHLGLERNEETLQPHCYLNTLPQAFLPGMKVLILEPMLATGGSILYAMEEVMKRGVTEEQIRIISVVASGPALKQLGSTYGDLHIYTAMIDEGVNDQGFIVPGLGDAGDRLFGTR